MFTEFKNLRKAFNTVFGKKGGVIDNIEDNYAPCDCGNEDDIVSADSISIKEAFLDGSVGRKGRETLGITEEDMKKHFDLAFQRLEDYVALAD